MSAGALQKLLILPPIRQRMLTYPKIKDLETNLVLLKLPEIVATEKIHGTNFRIQIPKNPASIDDVDFGVKGMRIKEGSFFAQFLDEIKQKTGIERIIGQLDHNFTWTLFGELYGPQIQKELPYLEQGVGVLFFDIGKGGQLLAYDDYREMAQKLGLQTAPELYRGKPDMEVFKKLVEQSSSVAPNMPREGIVIRDPNLVLIDGSYPMAKFKSEKFREKDYMFSVDDFAKMADEEIRARAFVRNFVTEVRIRKMADKLREQGKLKKTPADIPALADLLLEDIREEDAAYYDTMHKQIVERLISTKVNEIYTELYRRL